MRLNRLNLFSPFPPCLSYFLKSRASRLTCRIYLDNHIWANHITNVVSGICQRSAAPTTIRRVLVVDASLYIQSYTSEAGISCLIYVRSVLDERDVYGLGTCDDLRTRHRKRPILLGSHTFLETLLLYSFQIDLFGTQLSQFT
jgi:hypothetical protein